VRDGVAGVLPALVVVAVRRAGLVLLEAVVIAITGLVENESAWMPLVSPVASPAMPRKKLAASICIDADNSGLAGRAAPRAYSEPPAQAAVVPTRASIARTSPPPPGRTRSATPAKPTTSPAIAVADSRRPKNARSISATQSGMIATISAARPDSRRVSAQATPPLPIRRRAAPTIAAEPHCRSVGRACPREANAYSAVPATRNRTDDIRSGGIVLSVTRIAR
jgi:hypothetical protein